ARLKAEAEKSNIARYRYRPERSAFNDNSSAFFPEAIRRHCGGVRWLGTWGTRDRVRRHARQDDLAMAAARYIQLRIRREQDGLLAKARPRGHHRPRLRLRPCLRAGGSGTVRLRHPRPRRDDELRGARA